MKIKCPYCCSESPKQSESRTLVRIGRYYRKSDGQRISRFWCKSCRKSFSSASLCSRYRQKKRQKNHMIQKLFCGGVSQREIARILRITRKTVVRKLLYLAAQERDSLEKWNQSHRPAVEVEFDDMETFEHSKCKPLSITLMVEYKTRRILGYEVSQMPSKGKLAAISRKKYGYRADHRPFGRRELFRRVQEFVHPKALIRSDSNPHYTDDVKKYFPQAAHETILGGRGAATGQGELKKLRFDPIFSLNHTCAMFRANVNRMFRRTWCTTKRADRLAAHLALYAMSHNRRLSTA